jgi:hypothetical protein
LLIATVGIVTLLIVVAIVASKMKKPHEVKNKMEKNGNDDQQDTNKRK